MLMLIQAYYPLTEVNKLALLPDRAYIQCIHINNLPEAVALLELNNNVGSYTVWTIGGIYTQKNFGSTHYTKWLDKDPYYQGS